MISPTAKQHKTIEMIENVLGLKFEGESFRDAQDFISAHINDAFHKINENNTKPPTEKQLDTIALIEEKLNMRFEGETSREAREFISANIDKIKNDK